MKAKNIYILILFVGLIFSSCSELKDDITIPTKIGIHGTEALVIQSPSFHGKILGENKLDGCRQCHASNLAGGIAQVSCINCHPSLTIHNKQINDPTSQNFHGKYVASKNWNMNECQKCHGEFYAGGTSSPTCYTCHKDGAGPEACNTCHGDFTKANLIAPPRALNNATATTDPGVGAHSLHLTQIKIAPANVKCEECHTIPKTFRSEGHIDSTPKAEVIFKGQPANSKYDFTTFKCSNTYCHGNFEFSKSTSNYSFIYTDDKIIGNNFSPQWNKVDGTQAACGTCHGLPPTGHQAESLTACSTCHTGVVDDTGKIIDPSKHMNGKKNVFGEEF
ncbi:CxxxxCH/CxxCH domain c-type cytochrome [Stygiobacter electus]|uniref:CxxxxCH/CxxCH domain-containing protein n=1 Tax=Stygiobacter electus TaxID=3032292 RepID=A0AAE3P286_9BACT|nr:CxxxxCH/CxxCH domain-containing protein [Stygiobacter electus]MDF1611723.1 CxxxxCH/CxxCH domain-containing protein [Stygiobacter electus]